MIPENISATGTIQNLSDSGCSVTASVSLKRFDKVNFSITLPVKDVNKVFDMRGAVQRKKTDEDVRNNYEIEFFDDDRKILSENYSQMY